MEKSPGDLSRLQEHRKLGRPVADDITMGSLWHRDGQQWDCYLSVFDRAFFRYAVGRSVGEGGGIRTCLGIELRQMK